MNTGLSKRHAPLNHGTTKSPRWIISREASEKRASSRSVSGRIQVPLNSSARLKKRIARCGRAARFSNMDGIGEFFAGGKREEFFARIVATFLPGNARRSQRGTPEILADTSDLDFYLQAQRV